MDSKICVVGAGGLGTALAQHISNNADSVYLYARRSEVAEEIFKTGYNKEYYPNLKLAENIIPINDFKPVGGCDAVLLCVPSSTFRSPLKELSKHVSDDVVLVSTAKGIEYPSLKTMSEILAEYFSTDPVVLSGPNFAFEIALSLFTTTNIASENPLHLKRIKEVLTTDEFKVGTNNDVPGTEYCGVIKNINAVAYGICEGMNINENGRYAVLTKGFMEMKNIIEALGGKRETVDKFCGFGDLVLTATTRESRNHTMGMLYGQKIVVDEKASGILFEGKNSIMAIKELCQNIQVQSSIVDFVNDVVVDLTPPKLAFRKLWNGIED